MALIQSYIEKLQKSAINFLYIFIDPKVKGLSDDIMNKRLAQINQLKKIYQKTPGYTFAQLVQIVENGIIERYNQTPAQLLQTIYNAAIGSDSIGEIPSLPTPDIKVKTAAESVKNLSVNVSESGSMKKTNLWQDVQSVIEWLVEIFIKIFGDQRDAGVHKPTNEDWIYKNQPVPQYNEAGIGGGWLGYAAAAGIVFFLFKNGKDTKGKKRK